VENGLKRPAYGRQDRHGGHEKQRQTPNGHDPPRALRSTVLKTPRNQRESTNAQHGHAKHGKEDAMGSRKITSVNLG